MECGGDRQNFSGTLCVRAPPTRWPLVHPGPREEAWPAPVASRRGAAAPGSAGWAGAVAQRAAAQRTVATGGGMDYLTTFTGKSGRLLRGTASRLWGLGGGGEARQVRFEDYLREPAPGDPGCGPAELRPPSPTSPEGPGESPRPRGAWPPGARTGTGTGKAAPRAGVRSRRCAGAGAMQLRGGPSCPGQAPPTRPNSVCDPPLSSASSNQL